MLFIMSFIACDKTEDNVVTLSNVDQFKSSLVKKLPVGTKKERIIVYLEGLGIGYSYAESTKKFYAMIPDIGTYRLIYNSSLLIRIQLDQDRPIGTN